MTDAQEKLCDTHIALLDRYYDEESEMMAALRKLANAFGLDAEGKCSYEEEDGENYVTVTPEVKW